MDIGESFAKLIGTVLILYVLIIVVGQMAASDPIFKTYSWVLPLIVIAVIVGAFVELFGKK